MFPGPPGVAGLLPKPRGVPVLDPMLYDCEILVRAKKDVAAANIVRTRAQSPGVNTIRISYGEEATVQVRSKHQLKMI